MVIVYNNNNNNELVQFILHGDLHVQCTQHNMQVWYTMGPRIARVHSSILKNKHAWTATKHNVHQTYDKCIWFLEGSWIELGVFLIIIFIIFKGAWIIVNY